MFFKKDQIKNKRIALQKKILKYRIVFLRFVEVILEYNTEKISEGIEKSGPYKRANTTFSQIKLAVENDKEVTQEHLRNFIFFQNNFSYEEIFEVIRYTLKYLPKNNKYLDKILKDLESL